VWYTKESAFQYSASIFHCSYLELHISDQAKYYQNTWSLPKHFGLPPNYVPGSSSSNHPQRTIESDAKAVNFTFDNSIFVHQTNHRIGFERDFWIFITS
jgi:hypothetical protein